DSVRAMAALATPFEIPGLKFQMLRIRSGGGRWEVHAGVLQGRHYREWHVGVGRRLGLGLGVRVLLGARVFTVDAGGERASPHWSGTILARGSPHGWRHLELEAGIVDASLSHEEAVPSVLVTRALLSTGNARLIAERSVSSRGVVETTIVTQISFGPIDTTYGYRCSVGETSTGLAVRSGAVQVRLSQRWHPVLGWTPRVAVCWLAASRA
ncbi:MAG: hypothetical protein KAY24_06255, partial [Candidatus Eisenbacteria sp.]|nr:hypothetical protein [Candidatus Eisenbacteria bacterium]